jgi:hypothetical protein
MGDGSNEKRDFGTRTPELSLLGSVHLSIFRFLFTTFYSTYITTRLYESDLHIGWTASMVYICYAFP